jgi:hypothetical protein
VEREIRELKEWEKRAQAVFPEAAAAKLRPFALAFKRAKLNDGSRFVTGEFKLTGPERKEGKLTAAEIKLISDTLGRSRRNRPAGRAVPQGGNRPASRAAPQGEISEENIVEGTRRGNKRVLQEWDCEVEIATPCPLPFREPGTKGMRPQQGATQEEEEEQHRQYDMEND